MGRTNPPPLRSAVAEHRQAGGRSSSAWALMGHESQTAKMHAKADWLLLYCQLYCARIAISPPESPHYMPQLALRRAPFASQFASPVRCLLPTQEYTSQLMNGMLIMLRNRAQGEAKPVKGLYTLEDTIKFGHNKYKPRPLSGTHLDLVDRSKPDGRG